MSTGHDPEESQSADVIITSGTQEAQVIEEVQRTTEETPKLLVNSISPRENGIDSALCSDKTSPGRQPDDSDASTPCSKRLRLTDDCQNTNTEAGANSRDTQTHHKQIPAAAINDQTASRMNATENKTTLWIGDLERWEDEDYIYHFFDHHCPRAVVSVKIARDRDHQRSLGYGFIDFTSREVAEQVLASASALKRPHGRRFKLTWARGKTRQPFNPVSQKPSTELKLIGASINSRTSTVLPIQLESSLMPPAPFIPGGLKWCVDVPQIPEHTNSNIIKDCVLAPLALDLTTIIQPYAENSIRLIFPNSAMFFKFINRYRDGKLDVAGTAMLYFVPPDVMSSWTRVYQQSVDLHPLETSAHCGALSMSSPNSFQSWRARP